MTYIGICKINFRLEDNLFRCEGASTGIYSDLCEFEHEDLIEVAKHWKEKHLEKSMKFLRKTTDEYLDRQKHPKKYANEKDMKVIP